MEAVKVFDKKDIPLDCEYDGDAVGKYIDAKARRPIEPCYNVFLINKTNQIDQITQINPVVVWLWRSAGL